MAVTRAISSTPTRKPSSRCEFIEQAIDAARDMTLKLEWQPKIQSFALGRRRSCRRARTGSRSPRGAPEGARRQAAEWMFRAIRAFRAMSVERTMERSSRSSSNISISRRSGKNRTSMSSSMASYSAAISSSSRSYGASFARRLQRPPFLDVTLDGFVPASRWPCRTSRSDVQSRNIKLSAEVSLPFSRRGPSVRR